MQSISRCFTEYGAWNPTHHGGCSRLSRYEWLMSVSPIRRWDRIISSQWDFLYPSFHSPVSAFIDWSLLCGVLFNLNCHLLRQEYMFSIKSGTLLLRETMTMLRSRDVIQSGSASFWCMIHSLVSVIIPVLKKKALFFDSPL